MLIVIFRNTHLTIWFQVCITFGLTYNGKDSEDHIKWDGCANVKLRTFETATQFNHYILSFNINTNHWCAEYIYKRLKFLGSRMRSQIITLLFLALWHGFHSGYYNCFFMEFLIMYFERDVSIIRDSKITRLFRFTIFFLSNLSFFFLFSRSDQHYRTAKKCKRCWKLDGKHVYLLGSLWSFTL